MESSKQSISFGVGGAPPKEYQLNRDLYENCNLCMCTYINEQSAGNNKLSPVRL